MFHAYELKPPSDVWCALRKCADGYFWVDINSAHVLKELSEQKAHEMDQQLPYWAKDNPVQEYIKYRLVKVMENKDENPDS